MGPGMLAGDVSVLVLLVLLSNPLFKPVRAGLEVCVGCWILESPRPRKPFASTVAEGLGWGTF